MKQLHRTDLVGRGWTKKAMELLPEPNYIRRVKGFRPVSFWHMSVIEDIEASLEFQQIIKKAEQIRLKREEVKNKKINDVLRKLPSVDVPDLNLEAACEAFNAIHGIVEQITPESDENVLASASVAYLMDKLMYLRVQLCKKFPLAVRGDGEALVRCHLLHAIAKKYEWLAQECETQKTPFKLGKVFDESSGETIEPEFFYGDVHE